MSEATERLLVRIDATTEQLRRELKRADDAVAGSSTKINKALDSIKKSFTGLGAIIGAAGLGLAFSKVIKNTAEQERVTSQLNATLNSTQFAAGKTADELIGTAASLQKVTRFGDEAIVGMQSLLLTFKDIKGDNFDRTTKAVLDMSTAMGQDLKSSALQLGKALNDPIGQLGALSRTGVTFSDAQKDLIKSMAEAGRTAEAQVLILQELESQFGGSAEAARNTLGGALEGLGNAFDDLFEAQGNALVPMKDSLNELEGILSDPKFVESVHQITAAIISMGASIASALPDLISFTKWMGEEMAAAIGGIATDDIPRLEDRLSGLRKELAFYEANGHGASEGTKELRVEIAKLEAQLKTAKDFQKDLVVETGKTATVSADAAKGLGKAAKATEDFGDAAKYSKTETKAFAKALSSAMSIQKKSAKIVAEVLEKNKEQVEATEDYIEQLEFEISLIGKTAREQAILTAEREYDKKAIDGQVERIKVLVAQKHDETKATEAAATAATEAAAKTADAWNSARGTLSDFFFEFARDGQNAFNTLVDGFKAMIAKMIAEAAANRIILGIGAAAGGLGWSGAASAASSFAGGGPGLGSMFSPMSGSVLGQYNPFYTNTGLQMAVPGDGGAALSPAFSWANAAGIGAGTIAGGYFGNQVFGETSGVGGALGGIGAPALASALIPGIGPVALGLSALLGSFGGTGLESLFGGNNNGDNKGRASINLATGEADVFGVGKSFNQANVDALQQLVPSLQQIAMALGGSNAVLDVSMGNNSGLSLNGERFGSDQAAFIAAAIEAMVDGATGLSKTLKTLIQGFDGTSDELIAFATSLISIENLMTTNPVDIAVQEFADASERAGMRLDDVYRDQIKNINDLIFGFDGSAESAVALNTALTANKQLAYEMATALAAIGESTKTVVRGEVDYFNEAVRTPDESLQYMEKQLQFLDALLPNLTDPNQILAARDRALELNRSVFDAGPEDLKRANVQTFIDFADSIGEKTAIALETATGNLQTSQEDLNANISAMLELSAQGFQASADRMYSAAEMMYFAVQNFVNNGGQYNQVVA